MDISLVVTAATLAAASSLHCVGMCGPLAMVLPLPLQLTGWQRWWRLAIYHAWRILAYLVIGMVFTLSQVAILKIGGLWQLQRGLAWFMAAMALVLLLLPVARNFVEKHLAIPLLPMTSWLMKQYQAVKQQNPILAFSLLGFMHGLLPCGMVYGAAAVFASTQSIAGSLMGMVMFGVFTSGILLTAVSALTSLTSWLQLKPIGRSSFRWVQAGFLLVAALMVWRSQGLLKLPTTTDADSPVAIECHK